MISSIEKVSSSLENAPANVARTPTLNVPGRLGMADR